MERLICASRGFSCNLAEVTADGIFFRRIEIKNLCAVRCAAALAVAAKGEVNVVNCVNNTNVHWNKNTDVAIGGFFPHLEDTSLVLTMTACVNNGDITLVGTNSAAKQTAAGGFVARVDGKATFVKCINTGDVSGTYSIFTNVNNRVGGIMGAGVADFVSCVNTGKITANYKAGGIIAEVRGNAVLTNCYNKGEIVTGSEITQTSANIGGSGGIAAIVIAAKSATFTACVNEGAIISNKASDTQNNHAGGILGCANGSGSVTIVDCVNKGSVTSDNTAGGIMGSITKPTIITTCLSTGTVNGADGITGVIFGSNAEDELSLDDTNTDADAYYANVGIAFAGYQLGAVANNALKVRLVATVDESALKYDAVGYEVIRYFGGEKVTDMGAISKSMDTVYQSLIANGETFTPDAVAAGAAYFAPLTISSVPAQGTVTFVVRPYVVEGETVTYGAAVTFTLVNGQPA